MSNTINRFLGDTPGRTLIKLAVVSVLVGFVLNAFGLDPLDLYHWLRRALRDLWASGFAALGSIGRYALVGAAIVVPAFIIIRLFSYRKS